MCARIDAPEQRRSLEVWSCDVTWQTEAVEHSTAGQWRKLTGSSLSVCGDPAPVKLSSRAPATSAAVCRYKTTCCTSATLENASDSDVVATATLSDESTMCPRLLYGKKPWGHLALKIRLERDSG